MLGLKTQNGKVLEASDVENASPQQLERITQEQQEFLKQIPRDVLNQFGLGDLIDDKDGEDYLSESSVEDADFEVLQGDDFFNMMKTMSASVSPYVDGSTEQGSRRLDSQLSPESQLGSTSMFKLPEYDPTKSYEAEYFKMHIKN